MKGPKHFMFEQNCMYCERKDALFKLMIPICEVDNYPLYLLRNQAYYGRTVLAFNGHETKIANMSIEQCIKFYSAVNKVTKAIQKIFEPDQTNIGMFGDKVTHLHCHIVPKYKGKLDWGSNFQLNPQPEVFLSDEEYKTIIMKYKSILEQV